MPEGRRPGGVDGVGPHVHQIQYAYQRLLIAARLDPDGNEISTDEEEMIERARAITRRNNPQPFFNLFRPVVRASNDSPTTSRDDTGTFETQLSSQPGITSTAQPSDIAEGTLEVWFPMIRGRMNTDGVVSTRNLGFPSSRAESFLRSQLHQSSAYAPSRDDLFSRQNRFSEIQYQAQVFGKGHPCLPLSALGRPIKYLGFREIPGRSLVNTRTKLRNTRGGKVPVLCYLLVCKLFFMQGYT